MLCYNKNGVYRFVYSDPYAACVRCTEHTFLSVIMVGMREAKETN